MKDIQTLAASLGGAAVVAESAQVSMDRLSNPYASGTVTVAGVVDVEQGTRMVLAFDQRFATGLTADEIADLFTDDAATIAAGPWTGLTGQQVASLYSTNLNEYFIEPTRAVFNLSVRTAQQNLRARSTTLTLATDEAILIAGALVQAAPVVYTTTDVRTLVTAVLAEFGFSLAADAGATGTLEAAQEWAPGQKAWDFLAPAIQLAGLRLYCDERRIWHLVTMDTVADGTVTLSTETTVSDATPALDFEQGGYDSVVCIYRWTTSAGVQMIRYDVAGASPGRNTFVKEYPDTIYPGPGAAAALLARREKRRQRIPITAAALYSTRPTMKLTLHSAAEGTYGGRVAAVTFNYPQRDMDVDGYDFEFIPPDAVSMIPEGIATEDLSGATEDLDPGSM